MKLFGFSITRQKSARASAENPNTPLSEIDSDHDLYGAFTGEGGGGRNLTVSSRKKGLTYSAVWRGTNLIASDVAKLPLLIHKREGAGKQRAADHPASKLIRHRPNNEMTAYIFWQTLVSHVLLEGNGYAYIFRRGDGTPEELIPLNPTTTYPVRANGVLYYVTVVNGQSRKLAAADVLHLKGLGFDGLIGYSVLQMAAYTLGLGIAVRTYGSKFFTNDARPGVALQHPGKLSDAARKNLREEWAEMHSGLNNAHKPAVLQEGMELKTYSVNARDAQLLEIRQFEIREVANFFGVPPHKLGDTTRTAFASLEQENQSYLDDALDPRLVMIEQECREKLLTEEEKRNDTHSIEFLRQALVRADLAARGAFYVAMVNAGIFSPDEVRGRESMNPQPDGVGEDYYRPLNMGTTGGVAVTEENDEGRAAEVLAALRAMAIDVVTRMCKRLAVHAEKGGDALARQRPVLVEALGPVADGINAACGRSHTAEAVADIVTAGYADRTAESIVEALISGDTNHEN